MTVIETKKCTSQVNKKKFTNKGTQITYIRKGRLHNLLESVHFGQTFRFYRKRCLKNWQSIRKKKVDAVVHHWSAKLTPSSNRIAKFSCQVKRSEERSSKFRVFHRDIVFIQKKVSHRNSHPCLNVLNIIPTIKDQPQSSIGNPSS